MKNNNNNNVVVEVVEEQQRRSQYESQTQCGGCGGEKRWMLHKVVIGHSDRERGGAHRRLCTNCVLKTHKGQFCPICLHVYDLDHDTIAAAAPYQEGEERVIMCLKCPSISHQSCCIVTPNSSSSSSSSFVCPSCSSPEFSFFKELHDNDDFSIDLGSARALIAAAKISAVSMAKAASLARVEAERRVKEATLAKKRARQALETLSFLSSSSSSSYAAYAAPPPPPQEKKKEKGKKNEKEREKKNKTKKQKKKKKKDCVAAKPLHHHHQHSKLTNNPNNNGSCNKKKMRIHSGC